MDLEKTHGFALKFSKLFKYCLYSLKLNKINQEY